MSSQSIKTAIKNKLDEVGSIDVAYGYQTGKETGHPYAVVTRDGLDSEFGDSIRNVNTWTFKVALFVSRAPTEEMVFGAEEAERISGKVVDEVVTAFHMDTTLSGTCLYIKPVDVNDDYAEGPESVRFAEITLEAVETVSSS